MKLIVLKNNVPINEVRVETLDPTEQYEIFVGRAEDCHVVIDDPLISRHHLVLRAEGILWFCEKLSKLGSLSINGATSEKLPIKNGDEIKFGAYSLLVSELPAPEIPKPVQSAPEVTFPKFDEVMKAESVVEKILSPVEEPQKIEDLTENESAENLDLSDDLNASEENSKQDDSFSENNGDFLGESSESRPSEEEAAFGSEGDLVPSDENAVTESDQPSDGTKTKFDLFFVNYMLRLFGEHAPYDRFNITDEETFIGRDSKKCQIVLNDPEVSSVHAVLKKVKNQVFLEDLNSSNGTILNGERINKAQVVPGDEFVIGGTSFSFEVKSELLSNEQDRLLPVEKNQVIEREEILEEEIPMEEGDFAGAPEEKSFIKKLLKEPKRAAIYGVAALGLLFVLFSSDEEVQVPEKKPEPKATVAQPNEKAKLKLSAELENRRNVAYELGVSFFEQNKYFEALKEFQTVAEIDPSYKKNQTYLEQTKIGLKRLEELEAQRREEEERVKLKKQIEEILVKARAAVKEHQVQLAESYFSQITEKDPENIEVQQLKLELESWVKEEQRIALEKAAKEAARKAMVDALNPGKTAYLKKEWYLSILKLEDFLRRKGTDEDLVKEASDMLSDAKNQLASELGPMLGKARSLKEGQDLKNAYEAFLEVLKVEPTNTEALGEVDDIRGQLDARSKKVYREAIIAESLSLFSDAKEKFQEVQQVSPTDSEYYRKATEKLKNYLE